MKLAKISISSLFLLFSFTAWANCPLPSEISLACDNQQHCNWTANYPGWEGFFVGNHQQDTSIKRFDYAAWWNDHGNPNDATVLCIYTGNLGSTIRMSQGDWGGITQPKDSTRWFPSTYQNLPVLICRGNVSGCEFNY